MCGIVGYTGPKKATQIVMDGLRKLEYRGYDSAGIAFVESPELTVIRAVGRVETCRWVLTMQPSCNVARARLTASLECSCSRSAR